MSNLFTARRKEDIQYNSLLTAQDISSIKGNSLLHITIEKNNLELLNLLLTLKDIDRNTKNKKWLDSLIFLPISKECFEEIKNLIQSETDINEYTPVSLHVEIIEDICKKLCLPLFKRKNTNIKEHIKPTPIETEQCEVILHVLQAGHDINCRSILYTSTLQIVHEYPNIVHYFVTKEAFNRWQKTAQRTAVERRYLETVYTNPYHNIDVNVSKYLGYTPFSHALRVGNVAVQDALYQHYSDTVSSLDLMLALEFGSGYATEILGKNVKVDKSCLDFCFLGNRPFDENLMKLLWLKIESDINNPLSLDIIFQFNLDKDCIEKMLTIIIESENTEILYNYTATIDSLESFIIKFYNLGCSIDLLMKLFNRLLECSYVLHVKDIYRLFYYYGYCRLVKSLVYLDYRQTWNDCDVILQRLIMPRFLLDVHSKRQTIEQDLLSKFNITLLKRSGFKLDLKHYFASFSNRGLMKECGLNRYENSFPQVPKLVELARNESRTFIVEAFNVSKTCQYYGIVDQLDIPEECKGILKFEKRLYQVYL